MSCGKVEDWNLHWQLPGEIMMWDCLMWEIYRRLGVEQEGCGVDDDLGGEELVCPNTFQSWSTLSCL